MNRIRTSLTVSLIAIAMLLPAPAQALASEDEVPTDASSNQASERSCIPVITWGIGPWVVQTDPVCPPAIDLPCAPYVGVIVGEHEGVLYPMCITIAQEGDAPAADDGSMQANLAETQARSGVCVDVAERTVAIPYTEISTPDGVTTPGVDAEVPSQSVETPPVEVPISRLFDLMKDYRYPEPAPGDPGGGQPPSDVTLVPGQSVQTPGESVHVPSQTVDLPRVGVGVGGEITTIGPYHVCL